MLMNDWIEKCKDRLDPELQSKLRQLGAIETVQPHHPVLVRIHEHVRCKSLEELCALQPGDTANLLPNVGMFTGRLCSRTLRSLAEHPDVQMIYADRRVKALLNVAALAVEATMVQQQHGLTGRGIGIAILDTGVYPHPDLTHPWNRIITFRDYIQGRTEPYDDNGHGTHVAGCAASNGYISGGFYGAPAPEANIIAIKVLDARGEGAYSTILSGIDFCIGHRLDLNIRVMNLSLGAVPFTSHTNDPLAAACRIAWQAGIVVCAAAGNTGPSGTINTPGYEPLIITVGAIDDANTVPRIDDRYADYTSRGPTIDGFAKPDLAAPGTSITSLLSPGSLLAAQNPGNITAAWYLTLTGTSMATPICAGAVAQLLQAYPPLTPDQVKTTLIQSAQVIQANRPGYLTISRAVMMPVG